VEANYTPGEKDVFQVRPGISDWASIWNSDEGAFLAHFDDPDEAYRKHIHPTKIELQVAYVRNHSLWIDLKIVAYTLYKLLRPGWLPRELKPYGRLLDRLPEEKKKEACAR
jgi:lipopolysaccharide/colanic/teichoic acid biosynthesis glycosyltransferase